MPTTDKHPKEGHQMNTKEKAALHRTLAAEAHSMAETYSKLGQTYAATKFSRIAEYELSVAEKLFFTEEWKNGDLVRDQDGDLWQFGYGTWHMCGTQRSTETLNYRYGPLTRVLTYDPAKQRTASASAGEYVVDLSDIPTEFFSSGGTDAEMAQRIVHRAIDAYYAAKEGTQ